MPSRMNDEAFLYLVYGTSSLKPDLLPHVALMPCSHRMIPVSPSSKAAEGRAMPLRAAQQSDKCHRLRNSEIIRAYAAAALTLLDDRRICHLQAD